jgi:hypothetical protein
MFFVPWKLMMTEKYSSDENCWLPQRDYGNNANVIVLFCNNYINLSAIFFKLSRYTPWRRLEGEGGIAPTYS